MDTLGGFISIVNSKIGSGYVWGGESDTPLTKQTLQWFVNKFGKEHYYFSSYSAERWIGREYYDCSGLVVYTLKKLGLITQSSDFTANDLYHKLCTPLKKSDLKPGDLCFSSNGTHITHVGVYMGNDRVTHARGTFYGVVNTALFSSFNYFGRLKYFTNTTTPITVKKISELKKVSASSLTIRELPSPDSKALGLLKMGSVVEVTGVTSDNWYLFSFNGKTAYISGIYLIEYDELKAAVEFISAKSGISIDYWYETAKTVKWLDLCLIKIAKGFGLYS